MRGFGVRIFPNGAKNYLVQYRNADGATRRMALGRHDVLPADQARKMALKQLGAAAAGEDPQEVRKTNRAGKTVSDTVRSGGVACSLDLSRMRP